MKGSDDMKNVNVILATNILKHRKKRGLSQDELAQKLGVTFQAVSKWENAKAAPDVAFLPMMADIFDCSIDELFSRDVIKETHYDYCTELPWADDDVIRGVVCEGRKILKYDYLADKFIFEVIGEAKNVQSECSIEVNGNVSGGCKAGTSINVSGCVSGGCKCGADIAVLGPLSGGCNTGGNLTVGGHLSGGCNTGGDISCAGNISGDINCGGKITVKGNVESVRIKGEITCNYLKCDAIEGNVTTNEID